ncbi:MAG: ATP synthase F1 subunit epsilon [Calditrichaeota bacterium]|nr:MAG: ATP synthase F1 subunit epsilon [Calditrichota bacterium]
MKKAKTYILQIITPDKIVFDEQIVQTIAPGLDGSFGILVHHVPAIFLLKVGIVHAQAVGGNRNFTISEGFAEFRNNVLKLVVESAEDIQTIDVERAEKAKQRAQRRIEEKRAETNMARAQAALARAMNRLSAARHHYH